jgi:hypothetical protein
MPPNFGGLPSSHSGLATPLGAVVPRPPREPGRPDARIPGVQLREFEHHPLIQRLEVLQAYGLIRQPHADLAPISDLPRPV